MNHIISSVWYQTGMYETKPDIQLGSTRDQVVKEYNVAQVAYFEEVTLVEETTEEPGKRYIGHKT